LIFGLISLPATYRTYEHFPGLYGKTWSDQVSGHLIVVNKVAVLRSDATLARLPEFKVYANYQPSAKHNPVPVLSALILYAE